ncbi:MAG TPA: DUF3883 domain-containing protein, partial [Candidatus Baltobacteraceae bacterium]|nr:DUF3883 domain-containing protein [Candidatus Baltobacteraceae bacterium]
MPDDWSQAEVEATVSDYFEMLAMELRGEAFNKAEHNRNLQKLLSNRSRKAVDYKHSNISAIMVELGYPYIDGYKPLKNYQNLLYRVVAERLGHAVGLERAAATAVERPIEQFPTIDELILVDAPHMEDKKQNPYANDRPAQTRKPIKKNYLEMESRNQTLGLAGEKLILEFEHKRLWQAGKKDLANRIEHVAEIGDGFGFDIRSFETNGRERLIEVKTTRFGELTPFFASKNEVDVSDAKENEYQLYRLFKFT